MDSPRYFAYGDEGISYLKSKDAKLGAAIDAVGHIYREMDSDLFSSVVSSIIGQQISTAAQKTVCKRVEGALGIVSADTILDAGVENLQSCGMTFRKATYIHDFARKVKDGSFNLRAVADMPDDEAIRTLTSLKGIGTWTAEMILLFSLGRPDILSFGDLAILRGMRMVYHHRAITRPLFEKYRRRLSPYGSVASLYFWEVSHMTVPGYDRDFAPLTEAQKKAMRRKRAATSRKTKQTP